MCGIVALLDPAAPGRLEPLITALADTLRHRGPDAGGTWTDPATGVALGHRRLAIVDLTEAGAQPMLSHTGRYVITFNGEFYNFQKLRDELRLQGHVFRGTSDTEVALAAFDAWGIPTALRRLAGMFAFAVWDRQEQELVLARDRIGEKPLYYGLVGRSFLAGSELKVFANHPEWQGVVDRRAVGLYVRGNYVPAPYTIYEGISKLLPGTFLRLSRGDLHAGRFPEPEPYWTLAGAAESGVREPFQGTVTEASDALEALLGEVVEEQMIADVPLGALLSGGVDSSTIAALMQSRAGRPVRTFTIGFEEPAFDESSYARAVAKHLGTEHTELRLEARDAVALVPELPTFYDEPFGDSSQVPTALVSRLARQQVTVCLTGDGGDETFCGYNRHVALNSFWRRFRHVPPVVRRAMAGVLEGVPTRLYDAALRRTRRRVLGEQVQKLAGLLRDNDLEDMYGRLTTFWDDPADIVLGYTPTRTTLTDRASWPALPLVMDRLLWVESATSLPDDMLVKVDRAAMSVALETRMPLVDHRVVEFAWKLPLDLKLHRGTSKWLLRQVLYRHVPRALVNRPKAGFGMPVDRWLRGPLREWAEALLDERRLRQEGYFDPAQVRRRWSEHLSGRRKWHSQVWGILMFQAWLDRWRSGVPAPDAAISTH